MARRTPLQLIEAARNAELRSKDVTRRKCFISYHADDGSEVESFLNNLGDVMIPRVIGVSEGDDFIDSSDNDYVFGKIRDKYLADSTVTIVLVGQCTWARRFVDWEIYSSLRNDSRNRRNGLLCITLPSVASNPTRRLPPRAHDNVIRNADRVDTGYARWMTYPTSKAGLRSWIEDAFVARTERAHLIDNRRSRKKNNSPCP